MSDNGGSAGAGWFQAEGDPPGTQRYWDGSAWVGEPHPVPQPAAPPPPSPSAPYQQAPAYQPAGANPSFPPPAEAKKSSAWKWVVGLLLVFLLLVGGCSFLVWRLASGPIDAGNEFLAELQQGDIDGALALSDPLCFGSEGQGLLEETFAGVEIESYRLTSTNVSYESGSQRGTTSGTITFAGGDERDISLFLVEREGWLVCGYDIGPAG